MFGHTTNVSMRLRAHINAAEPHGYALLNGWVSPPLRPHAKDAEAVLLRLGSIVERVVHYRERFYDMPYERGLSLARCVFDDFAARGRFDPPPPQLTGSSAKD